MRNLFNKKNKTTVDPKKLEEFNIELGQLLTKYGFEMGIEDVPATKKIIVTPRK